MGSLTTSAILVLITLGFELSRSELVNSTRAGKSGTPSGTCAQGFGVCCTCKMMGPRAGLAFSNFHLAMILVTIGCGATTSQNCTYLTQTTTTNPAADPCIFTICKESPHICRIRLDFATFAIAGPAIGTAAAAAADDAVNALKIGDCLTDSFVLSSPGNTASPVICGFNSGQHSPDGCLQYFSGNTGQLASFNFPTTDSAIADGTTHLSSQCYNICFRQEEGKCAICFNTVIMGGGVTGNQGSFGLSISPDGAAAKGTQDVGCSEDYLQTDADELLVGDAATNEQKLFPGGIIGFHLDYAQQDC
ncbi:hypothetical protein TCAL_16034 [Tigriopus californicus]|uniref:CUB domain-containing protein n=1 Tax=Tigriopus californicus TaxID=6832 RepID=A0A553PQT3_TIGCA|nr:hypothetical protein TCAL_16034 [Tigriopus californicus]